MNVLTAMDEVHLALPAHRFYWALLDVRSLPRPQRRNARALGFLFEASLPLPIESVQTAFAPAPSQPHSVVACGMDRDDLTLLAGDHPASLTLCPQDLPEFLSDAGIDAKRLNLMTADFEPPAFRRAKRQMRAHGMIILLLATAMVTIGIHRRTLDVRHHIAVLQDQRDEVVLATVGRQIGSGQPPELRMLAELRSLQQTRGRSAALATTDARPSAEIIESFRYVASHWPRELEIRADSLLITPASMTLHGVAPASNDVQALADSMNDLEGWRLEQPQMSATTSGDVQVTLRWHPAAGGTAKDAPR